MKLGVNIDHIATLREARKINEPDPLMAINICKEAGAEQITIHLREDRRHINDFDARRIIESSFLPINMECSIDEKIIETICQLKPHRVTLVPEKREEVTTEGGLDLTNNIEKIKNAINNLKKNEIKISMFIDPDEVQIERSFEYGADMVEFHTGRYANLFLALNSNLNYTKHKLFTDYSRNELETEIQKELKLLRNSSIKAKNLGLLVAAGHGLNYQNVKEIVNIKEIEELNIGHSIIANSIFLGLKKAIIEMKKLVSD